MVSTNQTKKDSLSGKKGIIMPFLLYVNMIFEF